MTAEQQLERSVLEGKERDELQAIAQAMSLKTTSRTKKADIIDRILEATGVSDGAPAPATNGHGKKAAAGDVRANGHETSHETNGHGARGGTEGAVVAASSSDGAAPGGAAPDGAAPDGAGPEETRADGGVARRSSVADGSGDATTTFTAAPPQGAQEPAQVSGARPGARPQARHAQGAQPGNTEAGNRRGRRRRGRDRGVGGAERDLQGSAGPDVPYQGELVEVRGLLDLRDEGYGFLRCDGYLPSPKDIYVSISQARRFALRRGDYVEGASRPASSNEKYPALVRIDKVSGLDPEVARARPRFEDLTPLFPDSKLKLEMPGAKENVTARIVDLLSPIGKGQRGLIVSPPKAGKTTVMKQIAHSIEANNPEVHLMVLLVDERPEEVTDMRRSVNGEVVASTFDRPSDEHTAVAELAIERAKRLVEQGRDVVIILDGITRLARAYNLAQPATGRIMSGGVDSGALYPPKKFFGAARNIEEGGSLTILATALVETGSKMDEVIFEEFKGTGNMELRLDRRLAERRLYPSIDVNASSTRHEELLFDRGELQQVWKLRRVLNALAN